jgi:hypothetical protein
LNEIEVQKAIIAIDDEATLEELITARNLAYEYERKAREYRADFDQVFCQWLEVNGRQTIGETDYWAGFTKKTTCTDKPGTVNAILEHRLGDILAICDYLQSQPFRYGAVRELIGDEAFDNLFRTENKTDLKTGKPKKRVQSLPNLKKLVR